MQLSQGNVSELRAPPDCVVVLAISPDPQDHVSLGGMFSRTRWRLIEAPDCGNALDLLRRDQVGVLICEASLPDGSWREMLDSVSGLPTSPLLIVASAKPDDALWAEALNLGAYDVLSKPFDRGEVVRIVSLAWRHWKERTPWTAQEAVGRPS